MTNTAFDADALIEQFSQASAKQGEALRNAVNAATLKALEGRELTLKNIKDVLKQVSTAASTGAAANTAPAIDVQALLGKALAGMDAALLQAVEANRRALAQLVEQGASLSAGPMKKALGDIEKMEDLLFGAIDKTAQSVPAPLQALWTQVLDNAKAAGTATGARADISVAQLTAQARDALRDGRAASLKATQALMDSYSALVSGVLIGMSEGMSEGMQGTPTDKAAGRSASKNRG
jgi:hypothetical protein